MQNFKIIIVAIKISVMSYRTTGVLLRIKLDWVATEDLPEKVYSGTELEQERRVIFVKIWDRGRHTSEEGLSW